MNRIRLFAALALALAIWLLMPRITIAQPPAPPIPVGHLPPAIPVVPQSAGAFVTLKVSALLDHPDLKPVLALLAKQPDALAEMTELIGVSPLEMDRVTLFWPRLGVRGAIEPVFVVTTREPFNEARVLRNLKAEPVYENDLHGWRPGPGGASKPYWKATTAPAESGLNKQFADPKAPGVAPPPPPAAEKPKQDDACSSTPDGGPSDPLYYALFNVTFAALFLIDDHTLVFLPGGSGNDFGNMALLAATLKKNATGPLADAIAEAGRHTLAAGVHLTPLFRQLDRNVPPELVPYTALFAARTAVLTGDLTKTAALNLKLSFDDAAAAKRAAPVLEEGIATIAEKLSQVANEMKESGAPFEKSAAPLLAAVTGGLKKATVKVDGSTVTAATEIDAGPVVAKALSEFVQAAQNQRKAALRTNNLKQIGLALHSYHDAYGRLPTNVYGPKGELLLSWRVQLLPFMENGNLYLQFKMDEPWDGPNNKKLIEQMPKVYQAPDRDNPKGQTFYQAFVGQDPAKEPQPKGIFGRAWLQDGDKTGITLVSIADGTSNTIAVIEARNGVIWSKPDDLPFGGPVPPLGEKGWDRTPVLWFDGSVSLFPTNLKADEFWPFVTINGGEATPDLRDDGRRNFTRPSPPSGEAPIPNNSVKPPVPRPIPPPGKK